MLVMHFKYVSCSSCWRFAMVELWDWGCDVFLYNDAYFPVCKLEPNMLLLLLSV